MQVCQICWVDFMHAIVLSCTPNVLCDANIYFLRLAPTICVQGIDTFRG